jgi:hypothetical protein
MRFPALLSANLFRGALGSLLRESVCHPPCDDVRQCSRRQDCPYAQIFRPFNPQNPSGLIDAPRPFIFRTRHLDGKCLRAGDDFHVDIHLFTRSHRIIDHFQAILSQFETAGFGSPRRRAALNYVEQGAAPHLPLDISSPSITSLDVEFRSPTELKYNGGLVREPHFPALWKNARDRISALCTLYSQQRLAIDFNSLGEAARHIRLVHHELHRLTKTRRSNRTGQVHPLGGFIGVAHYEGNLDPFLPFLKAAQWTGVGRQTVWGKGETALSWPTPDIKTSMGPQ